MALIYIELKDNINVAWKETVKKERMMKEKVKNGEEWGRGEKPPLPHVHMRYIRGLLPSVATTEIRDDTEQDNRCQDDEHDNQEAVGIPDH